MRSLSTFFAVLIIAFTSLTIWNIVQTKNECSSHGAFTLCYKESHPLFEAKQCSLTWKRVNPDGSTTTFGGSIPCKGTYRVPTVPPIAHTL